MRHTSRAPLRLLIVTDAGTIPNWLFKSLAAVAGSGAATVVLAARAPRAEPGTLRRVVFSLYQSIDRYLSRRVPDALAPIELQSALPDCRRIDLRPALPATLREAERIDIVLDPFSLVPDGGTWLADLATYGVWSIAFGDKGDPRTQSTPGFWEVIEGKPSTATRLYIRERGSAPQRSLYASVAATDRHSVSRGQNHIYWKVSAALTRSIQRLWEDPAAFLARLGGAGVPVEVATSRPGAPGNLEMLRAWTSLVRRYASDRWTRALYREQWALAYQRGSSGRPLTGPFETLLPPADRYWADPFPIRVGNDCYIFHEELLFSSGKGSIVMSVVDGAGKAAAPVPILEKEYHLSYPFVFRWDGDLFMIPQTGSSRIELYRCVNFPSQWRLERVLLAGFTASDPTPAYLDGRWWLFANVPAYGATWTHDELHLFHADSPLGPWAPHRNNPIKSDVRSARPAGRIFERDGQAYRPAQDCSQRYGYAVSINRILQLNPDAYEEVEVDRICPHEESHLAGVHTFNEAGDMTVIDCLVRRRRLWADPWRDPLHLDRIPSDGRAVLRRGSQAT